MHEFELRHYDASIGRFVTTDPYEQFENPYLAMGNNPVVSYDPDGGYCKDANGNVIACPDGYIFNEYSDSEDNHTTIFDDVEIGGSSTSTSSEKDPNLWNGDKRKYYDEIDWSKVYAGEIDEMQNSVRSAQKRGAIELLKYLSVINPWSFAIGGASAGISPAVEALTARTLTSTSPLANFVYHSVQGGRTVYAGITNNLARRAAEHLAQKGINIEPLFNNLSRIDARSVEQALIEIHKLGKKGGTLLNKINSISSKNPDYARALKRGYELLNKIGYKY